MAVPPDPVRNANDQEGAGMPLRQLIDRIAQPASQGIQDLADDVPCQVEDPETWFADLPEEVEFAKSLCGMCPVRASCLAGAVDRGEPWGVWGGELFLGGVVVPRKRPRGRPRKNPVAA
ncbi:MAG: WhiB family transcriptional regulator [Nostocoides sp.]